MELKNLAYYCDLDQFKYKELFSSGDFIFDFLKTLENFIKNNLKPEILGEVMAGAYVSDNVYLGKGSVIEPGAYIVGPAIIGKNCQIRQGAYIRENVIIGDNVVIGHSAEIKNSVMLNDSRASHFNYVGDSLIGNKVNLGAGVKLANSKITGTDIKIKTIATGLKKIGAIIGDNSSLGCNTVTQPATFIGKNVYTYPQAILRGFIPSDSIIKVKLSQESAKLIR